MLEPPTRANFAKTQLKNRVALFPDLEFRFVHRFVACHSHSQVAQTGMYRTYLMLYLVVATWTKASWVCPMVYTSGATLLRRGDFSRTHGTMLAYVSDFAHCCFWPRRASCSCSLLSASPHPAHGQLTISFELNSLECVTHKITEDTKRESRITFFTNSLLALQVKS